MWTSSLSVFVFVAKELLCVGKSLTPYVKGNLLMLLKRDDWLFRIQKVVSLKLSIHSNVLLPVALSEIR
jgi:hypothetical protein